MATRTFRLLLQHMRREVDRRLSADIPDDDLLRRFALHRDERAFAAFVQRHGALVLAVCRNVLGHAQDAEDAFQATFLVLAKKAGSIRKAKSVANWLHGVAYRTALNARKIAMRRRRHEQRFEYHTAEPAATTAAFREIQALVDEEVRGLPEKQRAAFVLCCLEGKSKPEAARQLGWKEGTVSSRLAKARELLRRRLSERGVALTTALAAYALSGESVRAGLRAAAVQTAGLFSAGQSGAVSMEVARLAESVLKGMAVTQVKVASVCAVVLCLLVGTGVAASRLLPGEIPASAPPNMAAGPAQAPAPAEKHLVDSDGDPLPTGAVARLGASRFWHEGVMGSLALSPDGKVIATGGLYKRIRYAPSGGGELPEDDTIRLWDTSTGRQLQQIAARTGNVRSVSFSPDCRMLAAAGRRGVFVWDLVRSQEIARIRTKEIEVAWVGFSANSGKAFWSAEPLSQGSGHPPAGWSFHALDVASKKESLLWRPPVSGKDEVGDFCYEAALSPDGMKVAWVFGTVENRDMPPKKAVVKISNTESGKLSWQEEFPLPKKPGHAPVAFLRSHLLFSPDGKYLVHFGDHLHLWSAESGKKLSSIPTNNINWLSFSPDGKTLATSHWNGWLRIWDRESGAEKHRLLPQTRIRPFLYPSVFDRRSMAFSADGRTLAIARGSTVHLYDPTNGRERPNLTGHQGPVLALCFSPDGRSLTSHGDTACYQWEVASGKKLKSMHLFHDSRLKNPAWAVSFAANAYLTTGNGSLTIESLGERQERRSLGVPAQKDSWLLPDDAWFSPDGELLLLGSGEVLQVRTGKKLRDLRAPGVELSSDFPPTFAADSKTVAWSSNSGTIHLVKVPDGNVQKFSRLDKFEDNQYHPVLTALSHDRRRLAAVPDGDHRHSEYEANFVRVWRLPGGHEIQRMRVVPGKTGSDRVSSLAISPDGRTLALGLWGETDIRLVEAASGQICDQFTGHGDTVRSLAFSPDGKHLASGSDDNTILVWNLKDRPRAPARRLSPADLQELWSDLQRADARRGYRAIQALTHDAERSVPFLRDRLRPVRPVPAKEVDRRIKELGDDRYPIRDKAARELEALAEAGAAGLAKAARENPSLELRRRLDKLLAMLDPLALAPKRLRELRAIEALEHIATPAARRVLEVLAAGIPEAGLTLEAREALARLPKAKSNAPPEG